MIEVRKKDVRKVAAVAKFDEVRPDSYPAFDGVALKEGDVVLAMAQSDPSQNGLWELRGGLWFRLEACPAVGDCFVAKGGLCYEGEHFLCISRDGGIAKYCAAIVTVLDEEENDG